MQGQKDFHDKLSLCFRLSERVPKHNFYRRLRDVLDWEFLRPQTRPLYSHTGQPSLDPVVFFKLVLVGRLENISSDRRLVEHCALRLDILYFLGYEVDENLPWHSTISRTRQLYPVTVFEHLFDQVFGQCVAAGLVAGDTQVVDSAPVKANASLESLREKAPAAPLHVAQETAVPAELPSAKTALQLRRIAARQAKRQAQAGSLGAHHAKAQLLRIRRTTVLPTRRRGSPSNPAKHGPSITSAIWPWTRPRALLATSKLIWPIVAIACTYRPSYLACKPGSGPKS
jgi:transposase